jgi:hypothetical protein
MVFKRPSEKHRRTAGKYHLCTRQQTKIPFQRLKIRWAIHTLSNLRSEDKDRKFPQNGSIRKIYIFDDKKTRGRA